jgi:SET domain
VDAGRAGNKLRFINHARPPKNNCAPRIVLINGLHRIGIYALRDIHPGEELLFDYGKDYYFDGQKTKNAPRTPAIKRLTAASPGQKKNKGGRPRKKIKVAEEIQIKAPISLSESLVSAALVEVAPGLESVEMHNALVPKETEHEKDNSDRMEVDDDDDNDEQLLQYLKTAKNVDSADDDDYSEATEVDGEADDDESLVESSPPARARNRARRWTRKS